VKKVHVKKNIEAYAGPQCPGREMMCDTIDKDLHKLLDKEFETKKLTDLFMLALVLVFLMFFMM